MSILRHLLHRRRLPSPGLLLPTRSFAYSSAEEAAAERRRRKRQLRIEPPLSLHHGDSPAPPRPRPPRDPRLPDATSALVGPRLSLHNRVQSLLRAGDLDAASAAARHSVFSSPRPTVFTCNAVVAAMLRAGRLDDAVAHFHFFFQQSRIVPNVVSYNHLIHTHCSAGRPDAALDVYRHILAAAPFTPSHVTYRHLTRGLVDAGRLPNAGRLPDAVALLREMLSRGHGADSIVYDNLIDGYLGLGRFDEALQLFDELRERCVVYDGVVHATLMDAYFERGMEKEAMASYKQLLDRQFKMNAVTCNTLLKVLLKSGKTLEALSLFDAMVTTHLPPSFVAVNTESYTMMVNAYCRLRKFKQAAGIFRKVGVKPCAMDVGCYNNVIGRLSEEEGWVGEAEKLFDEMPSRSVAPDATTYGCLINGYFREGKPEDAFRCLGKMVSANVGGAGLKVDAGFYSKLVRGLVESRRWEEAADVVSRMLEGKLVPEDASLESVVMALCKEGRLDKVRWLLEEVAKSGSMVVSSELKEVVLDAFGREGLREEVEGLLERREQQQGDQIVDQNAAFQASNAEGIEQVAA